jgi:hypothetical protein
MSKCYSKKSCATIFFKSPRIFGGKFKSHPKKYVNKDLYAIPINPHISWSTDLKII